MNSEKLQESEKLIAIGEQRLTAIRDQGLRTVKGPRKSRSVNKD
jgi:hypothetical protein